jgi:hypothetical protein
MGDPNAERTFIMIKPDGVQRGLVGKIIKRFETKGFKLVAMKFLWVSTLDISLSATLFQPLCRSMTVQHRSKVFLVMHFERPALPVFVILYFTRVPMYCLENEILLITYIFTFL